jgi:hypothetical protein
MSTMKKGRMLSGSQQYAAADSCGILLLRGLLKDKMFGSLVNKLKQKFSRKTKLQTDYYSLTVDKPLILVIAAVCMLVLMLTGCGGGSGSEAEESGAPDIRGLTYESEM